MTHVPVMLAEVMEALAPRADATYLDATFGGGGYAGAILDGVRCTVLAIDRDPAAIARGAALAAQYPGRLTLIEGRFGNLLELVSARGVGALDGVVFDFGVSSFQLDEPARGFSFRSDGPLDMRMGVSGRSAADIVNRAGEAELADILFTLGEERHSRRIARAIVAARAEAPITTTGRLADIVRANAPRDASGLDRATRSFQALRLAVNEELPEIERGLAAALALLAPGGRLVAVAFHSLEDRIVKRLFAAAAGRAPGLSRHAPSARGPAEQPRFRLLTPRPLTPGEAEVRANPRARSAKLRAVERLEAA